MSKEMSGKKDFEVINIELKNIIPDKEQPRKEFKGIGKLLDSILKQGLIQPIEVLDIGNGKYRIVDGERRFRAFKMSKSFDTIPCIIIKKEKDILLRQLITDFHKLKLNDIEKSDSVMRLLNEGYDKNDICHLLALSDSMFFYLKRLQKFNNNTRKKIIEGKLKPRTVIRFLSQQEIAEHKEDEIVDEIISKKYTTEFGVKKAVEEKQEFIKKINTYSSDFYSFKIRTKDLNNELSRNKRFISEQIKKLSIDKVDDALNFLPKTLSDIQEIIKLLEERERFLHEIKGK